jgi:hypothetical protein
VPSAFSEKESSSSSSSSTDDDASSSVDECLGKVAGVTSSDFEKDRTAKAKRTFEQDAAEIVGEVEMYRDKGTVQRQIDVTNRDEAIECLTNGLTQSSPDSRFSIESATPLPRPGVPTIGDAQSAVALEMVLSNGQQRATVDLSFFLVQKGRALVSVTFTSAVNGSGTPPAPDPTLVAKSLKAMADRLKNV